MENDTSVNVTITKSTPSGGTERTTITSNNVGEIRDILNKFDEVDAMPQVDPAMDTDMMPLSVAPVADLYADDMDVDHNNEFRPEEMAPYGDGVLDVTDMDAGCNCEGECMCGAEPEMGMDMEPEMDMGMADDLEIELPIGMGMVDEVYEDEDDDDDDAEDLDEETMTVTEDDRSEAMQYARDAFNFTQDVAKTISHVKDKFGIDMSDEINARFGKSAGNTAHSMRLARFNDSMIMGGENKLNEDWGSSDTSIAINQMKEYLGADPRNPDTITRAAEDTAQEFADHMGMSYEKATDWLISMFVTREMSDMRDMLAPVDSAPSDPMPSLADAMADAHMGESHNIVATITNEGKKTRTIELGDKANLREFLNVKGMSRDLNNVLNVMERSGSWTSNDGTITITNEGIFKRKKPVTRENPDAFSKRRNKTGERTHKTAHDKYIANRKKKKEVDEDAEYDYRDEENAPADPTDFSRETDIMDFARRGANKKQMMRGGRGDNTLPPADKTFESTMLSDWKKYKKGK